MVVKISDVYLRYFRYGWELYNYINTRIIRIVYVYMCNSICPWVYIICYIYMNICYVYIYTPICMSIHMFIGVYLCVCLCISHSVMSNSL